VTVPEQWITDVLVYIDRLERARVWIRALKITEDQARELRELIGQDALLFGYWTARR
jgi:hypothetical protein